MDIFGQLNVDVELVVKGIVDHVEENIAFENDAIEAAQLFLEYEQFKQQHEQEQEIDIDDSLINNVENVCLENNLNINNSNLKQIEIDYDGTTFNQFQVIESASTDTTQTMPLRDVTNIINNFENSMDSSTKSSSTNDTVNKKKVENNLSQLNQEIRYETRTKLKRKRGVKDTGCSSLVSDIFYNEADEENDENQPPTTSSKPVIKKQALKKKTQKQENSKKLKSKKETNVQQSQPVEQVQQSNNNIALIDKENEIVLFLADQMGQRQLTIQTDLPQSPEFRHHHLHLDTVSDMIVRNETTGEAEQKMHKPMPIDPKFLQPLTLQMTCEEDNYDINNINRMLSSNNNKSSLVTFAMTDPVQNQYMRLNDFVTSIHNQQHNHLHANQAPQSGKTYIQTPVLYDDTNCLCRKTTKRKLSEMDTNETFHDELGFTVQYSTEQPKVVKFDMNNNNENVIDNNKIETSVYQQQQETDEDEEESLDDSVEDSEFKTSYIVDGQDLLDIDRDKSPDNISIQSFSLKIIKILFTKDELVNGIIVGEDGKNRSKFKDPLDPNRLDIVKDVIRHKYRMQPHEVESNWNAIRSKLNSRIGAIKK